MSMDSYRSRESLSPERLRRLLAFLDPDSERAGSAYERLRLKLIKFFEWRGGACADDLADRTIDRVGRKIEEGEQIRLEDPAGYFYAVARNVLREHWGEEKREAAAHRLLYAERSTSAGEARDMAADVFERETRLRCLETCLARLAPENRHLITRYYQGQRSVKIANRKSLAVALGIPINALRIRSHRVRAELESCVRECLNRPREAKWNGISVTDRKESRDDE
jgi:DNA-directed RNA polymerase specialized sigma24 family protein